MEHFGFTDAISYGPELNCPHSPQENLRISSVAIADKLIRQMLNPCNAKQLNGFSFKQCLSAVTVLRHSYPFTAFELRHLRNFYEARSRSVILHAAECLWKQGRFPCRKGSSAGTLPESAFCKV